MRDDGLADKRDGSGSGSHSCAGRGLDDTEGLPPWLLVVDASISVVLESEGDIGRNSFDLVADVGLTGVAGCCGPSSAEVTGDWSDWSDCSACKEDRSAEVMGRMPSKVGKPFDMATLFIVVSGLGRDWRWLRWPRGRCEMKHVSPVPRRRQ